MLCRVTTNRSVRANGVQIEKGMSVEVISQTNNFNNSKDKEAMKQAFIRKYGIDVTKMNYVLLLMPMLKNLVTTTMLLNP